MKTKNVNSGKKLLLAILTIFFSNSDVSAQGLWQAGTAQNGNKAVVTSRDVGIGVSSPLSPLHVKGEIIADSMRIFGPLKIGLNSMELNAVPLGGPGTSYDQITSSFGKLNFGGDPTFSAIQLGIGTTTTLLGVALNVIDDVNVAGANDGYRIGGEVVLSKPGSDNILSGLKNIS